MTTRHEFLTQLHGLIRPRGYLEIGVHHGDSLKLAFGARDLVGVDPVITPEAVFTRPAHANLIEATSDEFFAAEPSFTDVDSRDSRLDLAFIDGLHHADQVLKDLMNVMRIGHNRTIIACDDMLPRNDFEATRDFHEGDWAGDCWKAAMILDIYLPLLPRVMVDTFPTGIMLVLGDPELHDALGPHWEDVIALATGNQSVPSYVLNRTYALQPDAALAWVQGHLA